MLSDAYRNFITSIGDGTGYSDTVLHIHGGMAVLLATRVVFGWPLSTPWPLLAVFVVAILKEVADVIAHGGLNTDTWSDIAHTVFWPTVLFIGLRMRRTANQANP